MGTNKPPVPNRPRPQGLELRDTFGFVFSVAWFHRNIIAAIIVLIGLYYFVNRVSDQVADHRQRDRQLQSADFTSLPSESEVQRFERSQPIAEPQRVEPAAPRAAVTSRTSQPPVDDETARFQEFLASADTNSLIRRSTALVKDISQLNTAEAVMFINRRQQVCKRLRQMELTPSQAETVDIAEIETLSQLDAINVQHRLELPTARANVLEKAASLTNHPNSEVSAKAHLAMLATAGVDLIINPTPQTLSQFSESYEAHVAGITQGPLESIVVGNILQTIVMKYQFDEAIALQKDLVNRTLNATSPEVQEAGTKLHEQMVFRDLQLDSLIPRMDGNSDFALEDISKLYDAIEQLPTARPSLFAAAGAAMVKHFNNNEYERAAELARRLENIVPRIENNETQKQVLERLQQYAEQVQPSDLSD